MSDWSDLDGYLNEYDAINDRILEVLDSFGAEKVRDQARLVDYDNELVTC